MKVSEAIAILKECNQDAELMLSSDEEGNSYRRANISAPELFCVQDGSAVAVDPDDLEAGEYEGWEDEMFEAVTIW